MQTLPIHHLSTAYRMIFPRISTQDYAIKANAVGSSLSAFTMCVFVKLEDVSTDALQCLYSYATSGSPGGNGIYVCLSAPNIEINVGTLQGLPER